MKEEGKQTGLSSSQKRHLRKVARRKEKTEQRREAQRRYQSSVIAAGGWIEENHNGGDYSTGFLGQACHWIASQPWGSLTTFRQLRPRIQTLVLKWPPEERDERFGVLVKALDLYRNKEYEKLQNHTTNPGVLAILLRDNSTGCSSEESIPRDCGEGGRGEGS